MKVQCVIKMDSTFQESVTSFLRQHRGYEEVDVIIIDFPEVKFIVNQATGDINPVSADQTASVKNTYSKNLFPHVIVPLSNALSLLAKIDLIEQLERLGDKGIRDIIHKNHFSPAETKQ